MLGNTERQKAFRAGFEVRGIETIALNANGNPTHPSDAVQGLVPA